MLCSLLFAKGRGVPVSRLKMTACMVFGSSNLLSEVLKCGYPKSNGMEVRVSGLVGD